MTVAHKNLTGTDLHEAKGASTATTGQVPIADGLGGSPFGKLTAASLQTTGNPFGAQLLHVREEQPSGSNSSSSFGAAYADQVLNIIKTNEISGASVASNQITLPAGTYYIEAYTTYDCNTGGSPGLANNRIRNITAGTTILQGPNAVVGLNTRNQSQLMIKGRFTLGGISVISLQQYQVQGIASASFGTSNVEVYAEVLVWKIL